jgi:hypothetical protein
MERLITALRRNVSAVRESAEVPIKGRMVNRVNAGVRLEIALCHVGILIRVVHQYVVPRLIFGRARFGDTFVPIVGEHEYGIDVDYNAAVTEYFVADQLTHRNHRFFRHGRGSCQLRVTRFETAYRMSGACDSGP